MKAPALLANNRLDGKGLPRTKALAYYKHAKITAEKKLCSFG